MTASGAVEEWTEERLRAWASCVRRLIAAAPISAVTNETGVGGGHSTPPERKAIRQEALLVVDRWLARDLAALRTAPRTDR